MEGSASPTEPPNPRGWGFLALAAGLVVAGMLHTCLMSLARRDGEQEATPQLRWACKEKKATESEGPVLFMMAGWSASIPCGIVYFIKRRKRRLALARLGLEDIR
jgi:hypothetical protein